MATPRTKKATKKTATPKKAVVRKSTSPSKKKPAKAAAKTSSRRDAKTRKLPAVARSGSPTSIPRDAALLHALETGTFAATLDEIWPLPGPRDYQALFGLGALALVRSTRGSDDAARIIDAVLARWPSVDRTPAAQRDTFLQNGLARVGDRQRLERLAERCEANSALVLHNLAGAWAAVGDVHHARQALGRALDAGVTPAAVRRDPDFSALLSDAAFKELLDTRAVPSEAFEVDSHLDALRAAVAALVDLASAYGLTVALGEPANMAAIREAEHASGKPFPNALRALLTLYDGFTVDDRVFLGTRDFIERTEIYRDAIEFLEMSADYGTPELLECVPVANLGQPNNWLVYDPRGSETGGVAGFVTWLTADAMPHDSLADGIERQARVLRMVHAQD